MPSETPSFDNKAIAKIVMDLYGLVGEMSPLVSYEDQNAHIKTPKGSYVLKIANKRWPLAFLDMQIEILERSRTMAPELIVPRVIPTVMGDTITIIDGFAIRMLTFLDGNILGDSPRCPALYRDIGQFMARFTRMMEGYTHTAAHRQDDIWSMDNVMACKVFLPDVDGEDVRARIERFFCSYENKVLPKVPSLRKAVIHNDANEQNLLVDAGGVAKIAGLIDFGDMAVSSLINELAITLAYALLGEDDIETSAREIVQGYTQEFPLENVELEVLPILTAMRLVQSIILTTNRAKQFPDNTYIVKSQIQARALLKRLDEETELATKIFLSP
jgi:Ser/Thr protein kinase RdoA (MazF antagonist)